MNPKDFNCLLKKLIAPASLGVMLGNFIRSLADRMHYQDIDNPFYKTNLFDGKIGFVHIYRNISIIKKEKNIYESNLCYKNSWYLGLKKNRNKFNFKKLRDLKYYLKYSLKHLFSKI